MINAEACQPTHQERMMLDLIDRLGRRENRPYHAFFIHLSRLQPHRQSTMHSHVAKAALLPLCDRYEGSLFQLFNEDLVLVCQHLPEDKKSEPKDLVSRLFRDDPLVYEGSSASRALVTTFDLSVDYDNMLRIAQHIVSARQDYDRAQANKLASEKPVALTTPLDANRLAKLETAVSCTDLSSMVVRQSVCALPAAGRPVPLFDEYHIAIKVLADALLPGVDLTGSPWLFQHLARSLDQRLIASLCQSSDSSLSHAFSINLTLETITSQAFLQFDAARNHNRRNAIIIELQATDVLSNLSTFYLVRDYLKSRGYRICLDGVTHGNIILMAPPRPAMGFDMIKLLWSPQLSDYIAGPEMGDLAAALADFGRERTILTRCGDSGALEDGKALGISLFQGYHIDRLRPQFLPEEAKKLRPEMVFAPGTVIGFSDRGPIRAAS